jgi:hypothetical protein
MTETTKMWERPKRTVNRPKATTDQISVFPVLITGGRMTMTIDMSMAPALRDEKRMP